MQVRIESDTDDMEMHEVDADSFESNCDKRQVFFSDHIESTSTLELQIEASKEDYTLPQEATIFVGDKLWTNLRLEDIMFHSNSCTITYARTNETVEKI